MNDFSLLGPVARELYLDLRSYYYFLLPVFFLLSLVLVWGSSSTGSQDFVDKVKRVFVSQIFLIGFPEISDAILAVTSGLASKIDDMSGLERVIEMAHMKMESYTLSHSVLLVAFDDLIVGSLTFLSYLVLYIARYLMIAIYHFSWIFLTIMSPVILLFHVFSSRMTEGLFRSLIEVASWKIVWAVLSVMLKALPFGQAYQAEGGYITVIILNFVIAVCMIATPLVVRSLVNSGFSSIASTLSPVTAAAMVAAPAKTLAIVKGSRRVIQTTKKLIPRQLPQLGKSSRGQD